MRSERGSSPRPGRRRGPGRGLAGSGLVHRAQNPRPSPILGSRTGSGLLAQLIRGVCLRSSPCTVQDHELTPPGRIW